MRYYLIAGEHSGDLIAGKLITELSNLDKNASFRGIGGRTMGRNGMRQFKDQRHLQVMGFWEVFKKLFYFIGLIRATKVDIVNYSPDVIVFVDYPGFNLRLLKWAKKKGYKTVYYISPQVWAWKKKRAKHIEKFTDRLVTILPFEVDFYKPYNLDVVYGGNPLIERVKEFQRNASTIKIEGGEDVRKKVVLLPGSREQEIKRMLPLMSDVAKYFPNCDFVIAGISDIKLDYYERFVDNDLVRVVYDKTYDLLSTADAAIVTSGTATLETALFGVPQVVCYKGNALSFQIAKRLIKVNYISLVNLILQKEAIKELIQGDCTTTNIKDQLEKLLNNQSYREGLFKDYDHLYEILGEEVASKRAAELVYEVVG